MSGKQVTFLGRPTPSLTHLEGHRAGISSYCQAEMGCRWGGREGNTSPGTPATWPLARPFMFPVTWGYSNSQNKNGT